MGCVRALELARKLVGVKDSTGATALHAAVRAGHLDIAKYLVEHAGFNVFVADDVGGTPAHHASYHGQLQCLKWLVEYSGGRAAQISAIDGGTPLHFCTARGHLPCIQYLVEEAKVDVNERDNNGAVPMYFAAQEGHVEVIRFLLQHNADPLAKARDGMCAIHAAAQGGRVECLKLLIPITGPRSAKLRDNDGATPVHFCCARGHIDCIEYLLSVPGITGEERDDIEATPAHDAAEQGQLEALKTLVHFNADINLHDAENLRPWDLAKEENHMECMQYIEGVLGARKSARKPKFMAAFQPEIEAPQVAAEKPPSPSKEAPVTISDEEAKAAEKDLFVSFDDLLAHMTQMSAVAAQLSKVSHDDDRNISPTRAKSTESDEDGSPKGHQRQHSSSGVVYQSQVEVARTTRPSASHLRKETPSPHRTPNDATPNKHAASPTKGIDRTPSNTSGSFLPIGEEDVRVHVSKALNQQFGRKVSVIKHTSFEQAASPTRSIESPIKEAYSEAVVIVDDEEDTVKKGCFCFWRQKRRPVKRNFEKSSSSSRSIVTIMQAKSQRLRKSSKSSVVDIPFS